MSQYFNNELQQTQFLVHRNNLWKGHQNTFYFFGKQFFAMAIKSIDKRGHKSFVEEINVTMYLRPRPFHRLSNMEHIGVSNDRNAIENSSGKWKGREREFLSRTHGCSKLLPRRKYEPSHCLEMFYGRNKTKKIPRCLK